MKKLLELTKGNVLVVGLGKTGISTINFLNKIGSGIFVQDNKKREELSKDVLEVLNVNNIDDSKCFFQGDEVRLEDINLIVVSPGVPLDLDFLIDAKEKNIKIIGELELAYIYSKGNFLAITGTNGKTTTTSLVGEIMKQQYSDVHIVGNIGQPPIDFVLEDTNNTWYVVEVSSFQLESIEHFRPKVSCILNLTPDHMDRHKDMNGYGEAKSRIFKNQDDTEFAVVNFDDKNVMNIARRSQAKMTPFSRLDSLMFGAFIKKDSIFIKDSDGKEFEICAIDELKIRGNHNIENALAATAISFFAGVSVENIRKSLSSFKGVEHRLEEVDVIDGVTFINDSKGTNPDASIKAIEAIESPIILIAGGYDKQADFEKFVDSFGKKIKDIMLLGATATKIKAVTSEKGYESVILRDMKACVEEAFRRAEVGDTILLSPACASWDMYTSFEERGRDFKECVKALK